MAAILEQYRISDFLEWHREGKLTLNPVFQRGSVWTPAARSYLIDTILRQLPIPKIYLRTSVDLRTKKSIREVVDGQQRLRAIIDFADDEFVLNKRANEFSGLRYSTLSSDQQEVFLSYPISVGQLLNASNDDVLEVFARLNSYSVQLNAAEKRHAQYQGDFKWAVRNASRRWSDLWDKYNIVTVRQRVRMLDDSLMAEMFGIQLKGICDGGQPRIDRIYREYDKHFDADGEIPKAVDRVLEFFTTKIAEHFIDTPILQSPHFLMLFGALAYAINGIPSGELGSSMPRRNPDALSNLDIVLSNLQQVAAMISEDLAVQGFEEFWRASSASTQRIASRKVRFPVYYQCLLPSLL